MKIIIKNKIILDMISSKWAFPADDINSEDFEKNTISFLIKFNVIEKPNVICQVELI